LLTFTSVDELNEDEPANDEDEEEASKAGDSESETESSCMGVASFFDSTACSLLKASLRAPITLNHDSNTLQKGRMERYSSVPSRVTGKRLLG